MLVAITGCCGAVRSTTLKMMRPACTATSTIRAPITPIVVFGWWWFRAYRDPLISESSDLWTSARSLNSKGGSRGESPYRHAVPF